MYCMYNMVLDGLEILRVFLFYVKRERFENVLFLFFLFDMPHGQLL